MIYAILDIIYIVIFAIPILIIHRIKKGKWLFKYKFYMSGNIVPTEPKSVNDYQCFCCEPRDPELGALCNCCYERTRFIEKN